MDFRTPGFRAPGPSAPSHRAGPRVPRAHQWRARSRPKAADMAKDGGATNINIFLYVEAFVCNNTEESDACVRALTVVVVVFGSKYRALTRALTRNPTQRTHTLVCFTGACVRALVLPRNSAWIKERRALPFIFLVTNWQGTSRCHVRMPARTGARMQRLRVGLGSLRCAI